MPITPKFSITQNDDFVIVYINVPHIRVSNAEIIVEGKEFSFYCKPYLLKLTFPHEFIDSHNEELMKENDLHENTCRAVYEPDLDNGTITAHLSKLNKGLHFPDLDLTTKLLLQKRKSSENKLPPNIEVLSNHTSENLHENEECEVIDITNQLQSISIIHPRYGFNLQFSNMLNNIREDLFELDDPDGTPEDDRRVIRTKYEDIIFDPERYLGDFFDGESDIIYLESMKFEPFWNLHFKNIKSKEIEFDEMEQKKLACLPNKEYLISANSLEEKILFLGLVDLLFAVCFDFRINCGESNVESAHNITRISSTLSWLESYKNMSKDSGKEGGEDESDSTDVLTVIITCCKRAMIYPYIRHWKLARKVLVDIAKILFLGKRMILKVFISLHNIFERTEMHYILNKLYVTDYCVWIQSVSDESLLALAKVFNEAKRTFENSSNNGKDYVKLFLPELENWAITKTSENEENPEGDSEGMKIPAEFRTNRDVNGNDLKMPLRSSDKDNDYDPEELKDFLLQCYPNEEGHEEEEGNGRVEEVFANESDGSECESRINSKITEVINSEESKLKEVTSSEVSTEVVSKTISSSDTTESVVDVELPSLSKRGDGNEATGFLIKEVKTTYFKKKEK